MAAEMAIARLISLLSTLSACLELNIALFSIYSEIQGRRNNLRFFCYPRRHDVLNVDINRTRNEGFGQDPEEQAHGGTTS